MIQAEATLGHAPIFWETNAASQRRIAVNGHAKEVTKPARRPSTDSPDRVKNMIAVDHERFLQIFKSSEDSGEGSVGRQLCLFTERMDVCLGKKPEPGSRAPEVQQMKKVNLWITSGNGRCKMTKDGNCQQKTKEGLTLARGKDPALRVFVCASCGRVIEQEMQGIPTVQATNDRSCWDGFAVQVGFEQACGASSIKVKTVPDFVHTLHSFVKAGAFPLAVSRDMRLLARTRSGAQDLASIPIDEAPRVEVSLVEKNVVLHVIDLPKGTNLQSLCFSHDGTLLLATIHDGCGGTFLAVWSMITGKRVRKMPGSQGSTLVASFSTDGDRVFAVSLSHNDRNQLIATMQVMFLKVSPDLSDNFRTDKYFLADCVMDRKASFHCKSGTDLGTVWTSGNGLVKVFSNGNFETHGETGSLLSHFAARSDEHEEAVHRRDAMSLDQKRYSTYKTFHNLSKLLKSLARRGLKTPIIRKGSICQDGSVFAHVFEASDLKRDGKLHFLLPGNTTVLVWNVRCGELCHRFEHERAVTCVQVSTDGTILLVGVSGMVGAGSNKSLDNRLEQSRMLVYSLITREVLWEVPLMHEVAEAHLAEKELLLEFSQDAEAKPVSVIPTSEVTRFPCSGAGEDDVKATELRPMHDIEENLALVTADELLDPAAATLSSYRSVSTLESPRPKARSASLSLKPMPALQRWRSAAMEKHMVGLCVSDDGLRYAAKWEGEGEGGQVVWLSVGDVDWSQGVMIHSQNLLLLEAGVGAQAQPESIGVFCISGDGNAVVCSILGTCRVVVIQVPPRDDKAQARILWEFDSDVVPKALGACGEKLSVMGDKGSQVSFVLKDTVVLSYSLVTRVLLHKAQHKCTGKTLGVDGSGELRVSLNQERRVIVERWASSEVLYEVFDSNLHFLGISGDGNRVTMKETTQDEEDGGSVDCPCGLAEVTIKKRKGSAVSRERANHSLVQIDIPNFELFGPSKETCGTWMASGELATMFSVHTERLSRWLLFDQVVYEVDEKNSERAGHSFLSKWCSAPTADIQQVMAYPGRWSKTVSKLVRDKDYDSINLLLDACPVMWATMVYTNIEDVLDEAADVTTDLFQQGLANNDRLLIQLLLGGVKSIVEQDKGARCPVLQMECVTSFIIQCLKQARMLDLVEKFLKELPLIKIDETDVRKHVRSHFKSGCVLSTGWTSRDAEALTGPWGLKATTEEAEEKSREDHHLNAGNQHAWVVSATKNFERGYQYVCPLPRLCDQEFLELITAYQASPGLLDNESMRAAVSVLEGDLQTHFLGLPLSGHFFAFLVCLACFCGFVELCITPVADDGFSKLSRNEIWEDESGWGMAGMVLGAVSTLLNFGFLLEELQKMSNSRPIWTYIKPWNVIPWLSNMAAIVNFTAFMSDADIVTIRSTAAIAMLLLWTTSFTFLRTVRALSALVNMLLEIMYDMSMFVLVVAVLLLSFAGALYCLHGKILPEPDRPDPPETFTGPTSNPFLWATDSVLRAFVMSVLQSFTESQLRSPLNSEYLTTLSFFFFFGLAMLVSVVGMNALIAIMNNTYTRVAESEFSVRDKEVASVMLDKLRNFRKTTKIRWQKQRRWVHVLSPSEKGSLLDTNGNSTVEQIKRELHAFEVRQGFQLGHLEKAINSHEDQTTENVTIVRELDTAVRSNVQDTGSKQSKWMGMFKQMQSEQQAMQREMRELTSSVRGMERKVETDIALAAAGLQPDFRGLEHLPRHFEDLESNLDVMMPHMVSLQQDMARMVQQMQSFEFHMQFKLREGESQRTP